jgi:hypothetical protein
VITYNKAGLSIAEFFYDEPVSTPKADIVRFRSRVRPDGGGRSKTMCAVVIDLSREPEELEADLNTMTRKGIRRATKDPFFLERFTAPTEAQVTEFADFYDYFADGKGIARANRERLAGLQRSQTLFLSRISAGGKPLVCHGLIRVGKWAGGVYFASRLRDAENSEQANMIGRANRLLHWSDMFWFRENGYERYDLGMWVRPGADAEKRKISEFKEGFGGRVAELFEYDRWQTLRGALMLRLRQAATPFLRPR